MKMRAILLGLAILLTLVIANGEPGGPQSTPTNSVAAWRSPVASLKERTQAAAELVPIGTRQIDAERSLGEPTRRVRRHGPVINIGASTNGTGHSWIDHWCDYYDFPSGQYVCVTFDVAANRTNWMLRPAIAVTSGNTNDERASTNVVRSVK